MSTLHPEWLYVMAHAGLNRLYYKVYYTDGTDDTDFHAFDGLVSGAVGMIQVGYDQIDYPAMNPAKTILKVEFTLRNGVTVNDGETLTVYPYVPDGDSQRAIYYHNSYGGLDSVICEGDQQLSLEVSGITTRKEKGINFSVLTHVQLQVVNPRRISQHLLYTGHKPTREIQALADLFLIKSAYEYVILDGAKYLLPIIPVDNAKELPSKKNNMKRISFGYQYAWEEKSMDRIR